jgi:hypothetical protein
VGDCISARTRLAQQRELEQRDEPDAQCQRHAEQDQLVGGEAHLAELHRLGQVVVAAQVAAPYKQRGVLHQEHQAEADHQAARLEHVDVRCARRHLPEAQPVHGHAQHHQHRERHRHEDQRRDAEGRVRPPRQEGAQHQELAVRDVHDAHQPVLQVQPDARRAHRCRP